jgi:hypothetical protein
MFIGLALAVLGCAVKEPDPQPKPADPEQAPGPPAPIVEDGLGLEFYAYRHTPDISSFQPGDTVVLVATCNGVERGAVQFNPTKTYYGHRPVITAPQIAAEYTKDAKTADEKYKGRTFVVRGVFLGMKDAPNGVKNGLLHVSNSRVPALERTRGVDHLAALTERVMGWNVEGKMTAEELEAEKTKTDAPDKTLGTIEFSGVVKSFTPEPLFGDLLYLGTDSGKIKVECRMLAGELWNELSYGQRVKVRGVGARIRGTVSLYDCVVVERGPATAKTITAAELAQEYAADPAKTNDKYDPKMPEGKGAVFVVSGEAVAWRDTSKQYFFQPLVLKGADGVRVVCSSVGMKYPEFEVTAGTKVQVMGRYKRSEEKDVVILEDTFLRYTK